MYLPPHFEEVNKDEIRGIIDANPLGCVVAQTDQGLLANHIPLVLSADGTLIGHVAKSNEIHRLIVDQHEVLVIFRGDNAYISPNYYPTKIEHHQHVPTWNYQVVHIYGTISFQYDEKSKRSAVGLLTRTNERRLNGKDAWRMADAPADYMKNMLDNIVSFSIQSNKILAKSKLSQNREAIDYDGAVSGLSSAGHNAMATKMRNRKVLSQKN